MKRVDTCAAEFEAGTPYMYSSYDGECECASDNDRKVLILGGGPNRIGQGIEFDYCCCHASFSLRDAGYETIMMNSNPETVSTDYDTSSRLYFEPLTVRVRGASLSVGHGSMQFTPNASWDAQRHAAWRTRP